MGTSVILKIILTDGTSQRLTLCSGLPASVDDLMKEVKKQCGLQGSFRLQFKDPLFGDDFLNLTSISEVEDKGTRDGPMVEAFMARWPALFEVSEINAEFKRITTVPLQSKFLSQLDLHSGNLMRLFQKRGGQLGQRLKTVAAKIADCDNVDAGRECIIKGVCTYMGEDPENLVQEYVGVNEDTINAAIEDTTIGIYVLKEHSSSDEPEEIGIVLEGIKVLQDLHNVALAVAMLFGLMYTLNLSYPTDPRYTFEVIQKIVMELDAGKLSNKATTLKIGYSSECEPSQ